MVGGGCFVYLSGARPGPWRALPSRCGPLAWRGGGFGPRGGSALSLFRVPGSGCVAGRVCAVTFFMVAARSLAVAPAAPSLLPPGCVCPAAVRAGAVGGYGLRWWWPPPSVGRWLLRSGRGRNRAPPCARSLPRPRPPCVAAYCPGGRELTFFAGASIME